MPNVAISSKVGVKFVSFLSSVVLVLTIVIGWCLWDDIAANDTPTNVVRNLALVAGGIIAWIFALWRSSIAEQQAEISKQQASLAKTEHFHERFENASEMLARPGIDGVFARLSGLRAFRLLIFDHSELGSEAIETVTMFMVQTPIDEHHDPREFIFAKETAIFILNTLERRCTFEDVVIESLREDVRYAIERVTRKLQDAGIDPYSPMG